MMSLSRVELLRIILAGVLPILVVGKEFRQCARFTRLFCWRRRGVDDTQRLRQPARTIEKALGLLGHISLLQVIDQLRGRLASCFSYRLQNARFGDPAEIVVDGGSPASLHHVEADSAGQHLGLVEPRADAMSRDAALIVAVGRLIEGIYRK